MSEENVKIVASLDEQFFDRIISASVVCGIVKAMMNPQKRRDNAEDRIRELARDAVEIFWAEYPFADVLRGQLEEIAVKARAAFDKKTRWNGERCEVDVDEESLKKELGEIVRDVVPQVYATLGVEL